MGENLFRKPIMVSRLPKFGARPPGGTGSLGSKPSQSVLSLEGKVLPQAKINGMVQVTSLPTLKRKNGGGPAGPLAHGLEQDSQMQQVPSTMEVRKPASQPQRPWPIPQGTSREGPTEAPYAGKQDGSKVRLVPDPGLRQALSRSSDSLKALSLDNMTRSQSFSHFRRLAASSPSPVSRSQSFSKAQGHSKHLPSRASPVLGSKDPMATKQATRSVSSLVPPSAVKKSLLPSKPSVLGYKLTRPSVGKRPSSRHGSRDSIETPPASPDPLSDPEKTPVRRTPEESPRPREAEPVLPCPEDMSLSSTSSFERVDTSEEYMDDFDNLGDGSGLLPVFPAPGEELLASQPLALSHVPSNRRDSTPSQASLHSLLSDGVDWAGITGGDDDFRLSTCHSDPAMSPVVGYAHGSSLDLSPSDSSGGTYMWDEEGLEPLGVPTHPCGSYNSDINSMDILNNLDNLESCDLEEDDLMLDVDLPEDGSLHSDMDRSSSVERPGEPSPWGRGSGSEDREALFQHLDVYAKLGVDLPVEPDALRDMARDCSSIKTQLLQLRKLLQREGEGAVQEAPSPEPEKDASAALQVEALLREAQELREELREKEKTIMLLTQQMSASGRSGGCLCQRADSGERRTCCDKATQTPWTRSAGVLPVPLLFPWQGLYQGTPQASVPHRQQKVEQLVHYFRDKACLRYYSLQSPGSASTLSRED